jgi:hypothetical protein
MKNKIDDDFLRYACDWFGDTKNGLTGTEILKYCRAYSVKYGIDLAYNSMHLSVTGGKNKSTVFFENIREFDGKQQFEMLLALCQHGKFQNDLKTTEIHSRLIQSYNTLAADPSELLDKQIITETKQLLDDYPVVKKHYYSALVKFQNQIFERNLVDDLRFSFEQLLKVIFENDKSFIKPRVLELVYTSHSLRDFAKDMGYEGEPFGWDEERRANLKAELDAYYAHLYGLTRDELLYILDPEELYGKDFPGETFRVLKNKEMNNYGEYRTKRLIMEKWDEVFS